MCISKDMEESIVVNNICLCKEEGCILTWYNGMHIFDVDEIWNRNHCSTKNCHSIFTIIDDGDYDEGFECFQCEKIYCQYCESDWQYTIRYCKHCKHECFSEMVDSDDSSEVDNQLGGIMDCIDFVKKIKGL